MSKLLCFVVRYRGDGNYRVTIGEPGDVPELDGYAREGRGDDLPALQYDFDHDESSFQKKMIEAIQAAGNSIVPRDFSSLPLPISYPVVYEIARMSRSSNEDRAWIGSMINSLRCT